MKILIASTPATGHLNPLLAIARFSSPRPRDCFPDGHRLSCPYRSQRRAVLSRFPRARTSIRRRLLAVPRTEDLPPGLDWFRVACERIFVDAIPAQHQGLLRILRQFPADIIVADDMLFGVLPMLLGPR